MTIGFPKRMRELAALRRSFAKHTNRKFVRFLREFEPQAVLCTHFLPLEVLGAVKSKCGASATSPFTVCVVTDFEAHALWMEPAVDLYCVATEETKARLVARAVPGDRVAVTGIPVGAAFSTATLDQSAIRRRFGLRDDLATILILRFTPGVSGCIP